MTGVEPGYLIREGGRDWFVQVDKRGRLYRVQETDGEGLPRPLSKIPVRKLEQRVNAHRAMERW